MKEYVYADIQETSLISKEGSVEFLSNPNLTVEEKVDRMITYLTSAQSFKSSGIDVQEAAVAIGETLKEYREIYNIPHSWGTAVNVQSMVFGNMGDDCATGVCFTRDPSTGERKFFGEYLINAQITF